MRFYVCLVFVVFFFFQSVFAQGQFLGLGINPQGSTNFYKLTWYPEVQVDSLYVGLKNDLYFNQNNQYFSKMSLHHLVYDHESFYVHLNEQKDFSLAQGLLINHYVSKPYGFDFLTESLALDGGVYLYPFTFNYFSNGKSFRVFQAELVASVLSNDDNFHFQLYNLENNQMAFSRLSSINGIGSDIKFSFVKFYGEYAQATANIKSSKVGVALEHPNKFVSVYADASHYDQDFPIYKIDSFYENLIYRGSAQDLRVTADAELTELGFHLKPTDTFELGAFSKQGGWSQWGASGLWSVNKSTFLELDYEAGRFSAYRKMAKLFLLFENSSQFSINYELFFNPALYEQTYVNIEYLIHF
jgi:hypothetical protein